MEYLLRGEVGRAESRYADALKAMNKAEMERLAAEKVYEHNFDLYLKIKDTRPGYPGLLGQKEYDLRAVEKVKDALFTEFQHTRDLLADASHAFREAQLHVWEVRECLDRLLSGVERWEQIERIPSWKGGRTFRTLYDSTGRPHHFMKVPNEYYSSQHHYHASAGSQQQGPRSPPKQPRAPPRQSEPPPKQSESPSLKKPEPFRGGEPRQKYIDEWFAEIDRALADPSALTRFPRPPPWNCERSRRGGGCSKEALNLCECVLQTVFDDHNLKVERTKFHPDKYSRVPEEWRTAVQRDAAELFKWIDGRYAMLQERERRERW